MNNFQKEILFDSRKKSKLVAYLLGAVLGGIGGHRLYLKEYKGACAIILLLVIGAAQGLCNKHNIEELYKEKTND